MTDWPGFSIFYVSDSFSLSCAHISRADNTTSRHAATNGWCCIIASNNRVDIVMEKRRKTGERKRRTVNDDWIFLSSIPQQQQRQSKESFLSGGGDFRRQLSLESHSLSLSYLHERTDDYPQVLELRNPHILYSFLLNFAKAWSLYRERMAIQQCQIELPIQAPWRSAHTIQLK